jgi:rSAM/selenodomain-associated transferase 2
MISVIIPALNEERALPDTLASLFAQSGDYEVILVDGGSEDATAEVARAWPLVRVLAAPRGRAPQMNTGARVARGEILLFLHADTLLPPAAVARLNALERDPRCQAGGFHHRFSGSRWPLRVVSWLHNRRCAVTGVFYGDQAMFVRRSLFERLGGFPEQSMLEDVEFSERALAQARPTFLDEFVTTDSRKFEQMGPWRSLARCLLILACYELGLPIRGKAFFAAIR